LLLAAFPIRSAPAAAELAVAAVDLAVEQAEPEAPAGLVAAEARAAPEVRAEQAVVEVRAGPVEREAVAEPEASAGLVAAEARELRAVGVVQGQQRGSIIRNNPLSQPRTIVPPLPVSAVPNQQILAALAEGTGGFTIFNTNDLLGGLQRIASEQNEFYLLGYVPADSPEGSCHTLKVK